MPGWVAAAVVGAACAASVGAPGTAGIPGARRHPVAVGTFIQWYLVRDWPDARWLEEFAAMKAVGMRYLVLAPTLEGDDRTAIYPTGITGHSLKPGCGDLVEACLRNARKAGIQVFLGLNFHADWWKRGGNDPDWLAAQMQVGNQVADELHARYKARYPKTFAGWYWVWEVDNLNFQKPAQQEALVRAIDTSVRHLKRLDPAMPVMLCPFMNAACGPPEDYARLWRAVFAGTALGRGDIFCPQDCVGAGGLRLDQVPAWFSALAGAVKTKPGLRFWADVETFRHRDWTSAPIGDFVAQLRAVEPYVEQSITFAYSHYYSPVSCDKGFQQALRTYVRSGTLETRPPPPPAGITLSAAEGGGVLVKWQWPRAKDDVCGFHVYRDGREAATVQVARRGGQARVERLEWTDPRPAAGSVYSVRAYDFVGNVSGAVEAGWAPGL